jgi:hypothetical protein
MCIIFFFFRLTWIAAWHNVIHLRCLLAPLRYHNEFPSALSLVAGVNLPRWDVWSRPLHLRYQRTIQRLRTGSCGTFPWWWTRTGTFNIWIFVAYHRYSTDCLACDYDFSVFADILYAHSVHKARTATIVSLLMAFLRVNQR